MVLGSTNIKHYCSLMDMLELNYSFVRCTISSGRSPNLAWIFDRILLWFRKEFTQISCVMRIDTGLLISFLRTSKLFVSISALNAANRYLHWTRGFLKSSLLRCWLIKGRKYFLQGSSFPNGGLDFRQDDSTRIIIPMHSDSLLGLRGFLRYPNESYYFQTHSFHPSYPIYVVFIRSRDFLFP